MTVAYTRENGGAAALAIAESQAGKPYQWGGIGNPSFDCSGLCQWAYGKVGVSLPRTSEEQCSVDRVEGPASQRGDLVFFTGAPSERPPGHVGLYVGVGEIMPGQHAWTAKAGGQHIFFDAPYTDDPFGIRYDYFDPSTVLYVTRPALSLPAGPTPFPTPVEAPVDDQFICPNPNGPGDYLCSWSTRIAVGIPDVATEQMLEGQGAKKFTLTKAQFAYFTKGAWNKP